MVVALIVLQLLVLAIVTGSARDQDLMAVHVQALRAQYASDGVTNMALREAIAGTDYDADGGIGTISNDSNGSNDPLIGSARASVVPTLLGRQATATTTNTSRRTQFLLGSSIAPTDSFEILDPSQSINFTGGWEPWDSAAGVVGYISTLYARTGSQSVDIRQPTDLVRRYSASSGRWTYTAWQYIPSSTTGTDHYFILMNTYNSGGSKSWSTQVRFHLATNKVYDNMLGATTPNLTIIRDQWVKIQVDIDLDAGTQTVWYGGSVLFTAGWNRNGGTKTFAAVDLYGSTSSHVYYDDIQLTRASGTYTKATNLRSVQPSP